MQNEPERRPRPSIGVRILVAVAVCAAFAVLLSDTLVQSSTWRLALCFALLLTIPFAFRLWERRDESNRRPPVVWSRFFIAVAAFAALGMLVLNPIRATIPDPTLRRIVGFAISLPAVLLLARWIRPQRRPIAR